MEIDKEFVVSVVVSVIIAVIVSQFLKASGVEDKIRDKTEEAVQSSSFLQEIGFKKEESQD